MYIAKIESTVAGIPCLIGVINYTNQKGSYSYNAPSDIDYYGYTDADWDILDRKGYPAKWLDRKITTKDENRIFQEIDLYFQE